MKALYWEILEMIEEGSSRNASKGLMSRNNEIWYGTFAGDFDWSKVNVCITETVRGAPLLGVEVYGGKSGGYDYEKNPLGIEVPAEHPESMGILSRYFDLILRSPLEADLSSEKLYHALETFLMGYFFQYGATFYDAMFRKSEIALTIPPKEPFVPVGYMEVHYDGIYRDGPPSKEKIAGDPRATIRMSGFSYSVYSRDFHDLISLTGDWLNLFMLPAKRERKHRPAKRVGKKKIVI